MNIIQALNNWQLLNNYVRCLENGIKEPWENLEYPMWLYVSETGAGFSWFQSHIGSQNIKSCLRLFINEYEHNRFPVYFYESSDGDDWFSWIYRKRPSSETPRSWLSREENEKLGITDD